MNTITRRAVLPTIAALLLLPGCAIFSPNSTDAEKAAAVQRLAYAVTSTGTAIALDLKPLTRPAFQLAYTNLNVLVEAKTISGVQLREILLSLPVKELTGQTGLLIIENGAILFDLVTGKPIDLEKTPYVLAAATGIRDGLKVALAQK